MLAMQKSWLPDPDAPGGIRPWWSAYAQFGPKYDGRDVNGGME